MPTCFEFKDDKISSTPVWATLPSLPFECWNPNALGKIGSKLGTPIAMDSLTMKMERLSYARILVEVDASKKLVEEVEFILPNGVKRQQSVIYEYMPKFCSACSRFGHLKDSCQGAHPPAAATTMTAPAKSAALRNAQHSEWTMVQRKQKNSQQHPQQAKGEQQPIDVQGQTRLIALQPNINEATQRTTQPGVTRANSTADSTDSSDEPKSPTSTQHLMSGMMTAIRAPNVPNVLKLNQNLGGESPPPSS
ncbi:UNVERIFIED_CONTAM: hypothetical protein Sradi_0717800 [Sesamum radiatum]|uniref:DUF4283 domain-containing protein n=1 Tax=Sesamum radiatum TaxID=300843 RepID=A0AAW2VNP3_SESRA